MDNAVRINDKPVIQALDKLRKPEIYDIVVKALWKGADLVRKDAQKSLESKLGPGATRECQRKNKKGHKGHDEPMIQGIIVKKDKGLLEVRLSLYGDYRLKWFEMGTQERFLKRTGAKDRERGRTKGDKRYLYRKKGKENFYRAGSPRGRIEALNFLEETRDRDMERAANFVTSSLEKELQNYLK